MLFALNDLWILIAAALVFLVHLGGACIESGLTRAKNTVTDGKIFFVDLHDCIRIRAGERGPEAIG